MLPNTPITLTQNDDLFDTLPKAIAIKAFVEASRNELGGENQNKVLALYGGWGVGKTSLLKYLHQELPKSGKFKAVFFDTWINEKDSNLPLSLIYKISQQTDPKFSKDVKRILDYAFLFLKSFAKGLTVKVGTDALGVEFASDKVLDESDKSLDAKEIAKSAVQRADEFKLKFRSLENYILGEKTDNKLIVFIDDLDRCEPENVLALLSAIKLFFTYGERTIFLCAMDKKAVGAAVRTKYKDVINSDEYMEKIFDINFSISPINNPLKIIEFYFAKSASNNSNEKQIAEMFQSIGFVNARHLKKILNKFELLHNFKSNPQTPQRFKDLIPNLLDATGNGDLVETIFMLFFITLYEFYPNDFADIENYYAKLKYYAQKSNKYIHGQYSFQAAMSEITSNYEVDKIEQKTLSEISNSKTHLAIDTMLPLLAVFAPKNLDKFEAIKTPPEFLNLFAETNILREFCQYLLRNKNLFVQSKSKYKLWNYFELCHLTL